MMGGLFLCFIYVVVYCWLLKKIGTFNVEKEIKPQNISNKDEKKNNVLSIKDYLAKKKQERDEEIEKAAEQLPPSGD